MRNRNWLVATMGVVLVFAGCSKPTGIVSGTVSYKGHLFPGGTVNFVGEGNWVARGEIQADGTYVVESIPTGPVQIAVDPPRLPAGLPLGIQTPNLPIKKKWFMIPAKFRDPTQSGVVCTVQEGKQEFNIALEP